jgi:hypothetical protein
MKALATSPVQVHGSDTLRECRGNLGDLAEMLELPSLFPAQSVDTAVVEKPSGKPWRAARSAEVLLLGDSFANIYHEEKLGWGAAGFAFRFNRGPT